MKNNKQTFGVLAEITRFVFLVAIVGTFVVLGVMLVLPFF